MCICHLCNFLGIFIGDILYAFQKIFQCLAVASVYTCLMVSFTVILMLGVGLGYNHCYVEMKGKKGEGNKYNMARVGEGGGENTGDNTINYNDEALTSEVPESSPKEHMELAAGPMVYEEEKKRRRDLNMSVRVLGKTTTEQIPLFPTMIVPLRSNNILMILEKIRKRRLNVTLELISK